MSGLSSHIVIEVVDDPDGKDDVVGDGENENAQIPKGPFPFQMLMKKMS